MADASAGIRVALTGAAGRMGQEVVRTLAGYSDMSLVLAIDRSEVGSPMGNLVPEYRGDLAVEDRLGAGLDRTGPEVLVDFTTAAAAPVNAEMALKRGIAVVIGATGITKEAVRELGRLCQEHKTPAMIVPNFAIGAVLMMRFAELAAKWLPDVEIIELHHDRKEDAPSGTAMRTAELISASRGSQQGPRTRQSIKVEGVRGGQHHDVAIHSVRLKGLLAHQEVIFGGTGEVLTLRHDSMDRACFMEGVKLCVRAVRQLEGLTVGMEKLIFG